MIRNKRSELIAALALIAPFVVIFSIFFLYPTYRMVEMSFTDAPLVGAGEWVGLDNYVKLLGDKLFRTAVTNTAWFVVLTVVPNTLLGLGIALMVNRLKGWQQSVILAMFFLPYILPVSVVFIIWQWMFDLQFGIMQPIVAFFAGKPTPPFRTVSWALPAVAFVTLWWTCGFNVLLFLAGLRNIPTELFEAARLDNASRWTVFRRIVWPLIWPVTALILTIQMIAQIKIFDQVYLFLSGGRADPTMVLVQYVYQQAFQRDKGGYGATISVALFALVIIVSVFQYQVLRARGEK